MINKDSKVIVVDDLELTRVIVTNSLKKLGYTKVETASDGLEARDKITKAHEAKSPFDFALLDWNMPNLNGFDLLLELRGKPEFDNLVIFMLTAESETDLVVEAVFSGANDYIIKPYDEAVLLEKINVFNSKAT